MQKSGVRQVVFDVQASWQVPDLASLVPPGGQVRNHSDRATSSYFDTAAGRLRGLGLTLERRQSDNGVSWLLVLPDGGVQAGFENSAQSHRLPGSLARQLDGLLAGEPLVEVASLSASRVTHRVLADDGEVVVEVSDRQYLGAAVGDPSSSRQWREMELRPGPGTDKTVVEGLRQVIKGSGGTKHHEVMTPLDRLLGRPALIPPGKKLARRVAEYMSEQCAEMLLSDVALRDHNDVESVHRMRVAIRRLRSVIKGFHGLVQPEAGDLSTELRWVARQLGAIRDLDVLDARMTDAVGMLPDGDKVGPVERHLQETLYNRRGEAYESWRQTWVDGRYQRVMAAAGRWHLQPPVGAISFRSAKKVLAQTTRRVNRDLAAAGSDPERLHDARKAAKRLRYVAEVLTPLTGPAAGMVKRAARLQTRLGEHQDAMAATQLLAELGHTATGEDGDSGFSLGLLLAQQRELAARSLLHVPKHL